MFGLSFRLKYWFYRKVLRRSYHITADLGSLDGDYTIVWEKRKDGTLRIIKKI